MGYMCDFCGEQRSVIYCRSDAASLCLSCDRNIHSANSLSRRHSRTLVCERCNKQPALVRCIEERISLCPNCDWQTHSNTSAISTHKRQAVSCYSGCPSAAELSNMWSFLLDFQSIGDTTCEQGIGSMSITDNRPNDNSKAEEENNIPGESVAAEAEGLQKMDKPTFRMVMGSSVPLNVEQATGAASAASPRLSETKGTFLYDGADGFYDSFNIDEVDVDLSMENYDDLYDRALNNPEQLFADDDIGDFFGMKDMTGVDSNCQSGHLLEGPPSGLIGRIQPSCSNAESAESMMSCKTEPANLCFAKQLHSNLSFSGLTGESSAGDYQDCGASPMLLMGEPPWCPPGPESSLPSTSNRNDAVLRYKEKKKTRKFEKKVRYASRKARADVRRRVKGRFVKAGDRYDYDPMNQTMSI
ncbi:hypothetical protein LIER_03427 [Lithospermum erythrorhizon]|uniref:Uncharacterized protein n=1 Tax=Lithospermum erythrorhizon TaxID=34254 RepID=A0AAV3NUE9_LITER